MSDGANFPQLDPTVTLASIADFSKRLGVVKLKSAVLTEAQEEQIRNLIRELFDEAPRS